MPTLSVSTGLQGYRNAIQLEGGFTGELTGGMEWPGRTRIEVGAALTAHLGSCNLNCGPWQVETLALFGEIARLLGERGAKLRFVLAARAGYERFLPWDRNGFAATGRMGGELRLGGGTALSFVGFAGWAAFEDSNPGMGTDLAGLRLGVDIGVRVYPGSGETATDDRPARRRAP